MAGIRHSKDSRQKQEAGAGDRLRRLLCFCGECVEVTIATR